VAAFATIIVTAFGFSEKALFNVIKSVFHVDAHHYCGRDIMGHQG
jgi:hypothetical protein